MERRDFLKNSAIGSTCILAGTLVPNDAAASSQREDFTVKITVLRKTLNEEWYKEFMDYDGKPCEIFTEGEEFIVESPWEAPKGFCQWAWADIRTYIHLVKAGKFDKFATCCTDGFRPVFFKIERI